jgi:hypothetical protein
MTSATSTSSVAASSPADRISTLPPWDFDGGIRTLGFAAATWAEEWLVQPNGPRAGQKFRLTKDQLTFLLWWYAVDEEGRWLFHHGARRLAKGSGKSPFAAVLALIEFCAPVRLAANWKDDRVLGGCVGRPVDMPLVQIAATAESQTANTMRMVRALAPKRSQVVEAYGLDPGKTIYYRLPEGTLEVITSSVTASEGAEATFVVADETEWWKPSNGGPELAATLEDNLAKSGSRMLETSNAWVPGIGSVAEATWDAWLAQEEGRLRGETKILYDARMAPADTDLADPPSLRAALEWVYADCDWRRARPDGPPDVRPLMERIWSPKSAPSESKRKYLNWPSSPTDAWATAEEWKACGDPSVEVAEDEEIVAFFDGSKSRDATALVGCRVSDGHVFLVAAWERPLGPAGDGWQVPVDLVDAAVERMFGHWSVVGFFADVREWESYVHTAWPSRHGDDLVIWAQPAGRSASRIAWDMRGHVMDFTLAAEACLSDIQERAFTHDAHPVLLRHVVNARRRPNRWGISIGKESPDSPNKIDAAVCAIGARMVRRFLLSSPEWGKRQGGGKGSGRVVGF